MNEDVFVILERIKTAVLQMTNLSLNEKKALWNDISRDCRLLRTASYAHNGGGNIRTVIVGIETACKAMATRRIRDRRPDSYFQSEALAELSRLRMPTCFGAINN